MDIGRREIISEFVKLGIKKRARNFILPMIESLSISNSEYGLSLLDVNIIIEDRQAVLIFDNKSDDDSFKTLIYKLTCHHSYIEESSRFGDYSNELILNFRIPDEYKEDFDKFILGKYSKFSDKFKNRLKSVHNQHETSEHVGFYSWYDGLHPSENKIMERANELGFKNWKEIRELWSVPDIKYEIFYDIDELRSIYNSLLKDDRKDKWVESKK